MQLDELKSSLNAALTTARDGLAKCEAEIRIQEELKKKFAMDLKRVEAALRAIDNPEPPRARPGRKPRTATPPAPAAASTDPTSEGGA